jgi:hypothetical protein
MGPCWALVTFAVILSPLILGYFVLASPWIISYSIRDHQEQAAYRKTHPAEARPLPGKEAVAEACSPYFGYTSTQLTLPPDAPSISESTRQSLDTQCPAHRVATQQQNVPPQPQPTLVPAPDAP